MKIGIDISQLAYENTGVANYLKDLITNLVRTDATNEYILFYASLRRKLPMLPFISAKNVTVKSFAIPPRILEVLWNRMHILPIETFLGELDVFISSDWTEPPSKKAKKVTILYDLVVYKHPEETDETIIRTQKRKLAWVKKETDKILCISKATMHDAKEILHIDPSRLQVVYPGI